MIDRLIVYKFTNAATSGPFTLNLNTKGAKTLKKKDATGTIVDITISDIPAANTIIPIRYNGTYLVIEGGTFNLTNGNGTTANGSSVDLGGTLTASTVINGAGHSFDIGLTTQPSQFTVNADHIVFTSNTDIDINSSGAVNMSSTFGAALTAPEIDIISSIGSINMSSIFGVALTTDNTHNLTLSSGLNNFIMTDALNTFNRSVNFRSGSATAGTYPYKMTSGALLTVPVIGVHEFLTDKFYGTISTGTARKEFTLNDIALTSGRLPFTTTNGRVTDHANLLYSSSTGISTATNITLNTAGAGVLIKEGTNATAGLATLSSGTVVVNTTKVTANSRIQLTAQNLGTITIPVGLAVSTRTPGTSFTILSGNLTDTSTIAWVIIEPAP
jgi:hypothetical protein